MGAPFIGREALATGTVTDHALRRRFRAIYPGVYLPNDATITPLLRAEAAWLWSRRRGVIAGMSAAAAHGAKWIPDGTPAELIHTNRRAPQMLSLHSDTLTFSESMTVHGLAVTTPARTAYDIGRRSGLRLGVERLDALMNATGVDVDDIQDVADAHRGARGIVRLREILRLADGGAESPWETRTRLIVVAAGLPRLETQLSVEDQFGDFIARLDMGWREHKVGLEFDGAQHWNDARQRARDIDRAAELAEAGWTIVRVSADLVRFRPATIVSRVADALGYRVPFFPAPTPLRRACGFR